MAVPLLAIEMEILMVDGQLDCMDHTVIYPLPDGFITVNKESFMKIGKVKKESEFFIIHQQKLFLITLMENILEPPLKT